MNKFKEIALSWIISFNPTPAQKETAEHRINKCNECPNRKYLKTFNSWSCGLCGCLINGKIFSPKGPEACPDKPPRWKK